MHGKVDSLKSKQNDLLEKLQKYKEAKQQKKEQERALAQSKKAGNPKVNKVQNVPDRRATIGFRQPGPRPQVNTDRRKTISHRPSPHQLGRRRSLGGKRAPLVETKQISQFHTKSAARTMKNNPSASAPRPNKRKLSPTENRATAVKKRSFTVTPEKVLASPGLKRPIVHVLDSNRTCSPAKRRRTDTLPKKQMTSIKPAVSKPSVPCPPKLKRDTGLTSQASMREKLLMWKQTKVTEPPISTSSKASRAPSASHQVSAKVTSRPNAAKVPTGRPAVVNKNHGNTQNSAMTAAERRKAYAAQLRSRSETRAPSDKKTTVIARSVSCAPTKSTKSHRRSSTSVANQCKSSEKARSRTTFTKPIDNSSRRRSVAPSSAASKKAEALNRRKSYASSLQTHIKMAPEHPKKPRKSVDTTKGTKSKASTSVCSKSAVEGDASKPGPDSLPSKPDTECVPNAVTDCPTKRTKTTAPVMDRSEAKQVAVVCPQNHSPNTQAELDKLDYSPTLVFSPVPFKTPRDKMRRSVRFLTPQSEAKLACAKTPAPASCASGTPSGQNRMTPLQKEKSMREKLDSWLMAHGKTPTRYKHLLRFGDFCDDTVKLRHRPGGLSIRQLARQIDAIEIEQKTLEEEVFPEVDEAFLNDSMVTDPVSERLEEILSECIILLESDCPAETVSQWLTQICDNLEGAKQHAKYWICRAKIAQQTGNDSAVISVFEESVRHNAQPPEEVADALKQFVEEMSARSYIHRIPDTTSCTPRKRARDVQEENIVTSSTIKYCFTETTPFFSRLHSRARGSHCTPHSKVTPVRRSTRLSANAALPDMLRDHDLIVESLDRLPEEQRHTTLYTPNRALSAELEAALDDSY